MDFRHSSRASTKFNLIASKLVPLDSRLNMMLIKLSFTAIPKIKQQLCEIHLLFMSFIVLIVVLII